MGTSWRFIALAALLTLSIGTARAHEVDQFSVPAGKQFVDLADLWDALLYESVRGGVEQLNAQILLAQQMQDPTAREKRLAELHSHDVLAKAVFDTNPHAYFLIEQLEKKLYAPEELAKHPGMILGYRSPLTGCLYSRVSLVPDPRQFVRVSLLRCSTIKVHDTYIGCDKIGHFFGMGYLYYVQYSKATRAGLSQIEAVARAVEYGRSGPISEKGMIGAALAGIYSNGDMMANYLGLKYFLNLTQPVTIKGRMMAPMVGRDGDLWALQPHVTPKSELYGMYITGHLDEALNPSLLDWGLRSSIKAGIKYRSNDLLDWYCGQDPAKRNRNYFDRMLHEYMSYYGEDYGHSGQLDKLVTIGNTCFDEPIVQKPSPPPSDSWIRTTAGKLRPRF